MPPLNSSTPCNRFTNYYIIILLYFQLNIFKSKLIHVKDVISYLLILF
nr:MAG TPA: hypothetical protein [Caudoviricetes sp.]